MHTGCESGVGLRRSGFYPQARPPAFIAANPRIIRVTVKTAKLKEEFVVPENSTIKQFKEEISKHFNCQTSQLVLVFVGRILKDQDTLRQRGIQDGITVHLVIRTQKRPQENPLPHVYVARNVAPAPAPSGVTPAHSSDFDLSRRGLGVNLSSTELQSPLQLLASSEMMARKVENPFIQSMLSNPDLMRQLIMAHPQMQQLAQQIPEISRILNNADIMRKMLDIVRNPEMMQEMRSQDRALSNLENIPGGDNALRCAYAEPQEPMLSAAQEQFGNLPFAMLVRNPSLEGVGRGGQPSCLDHRDLLAPPSVSQSATSIYTNSICGDLDCGVTSSSTNPLGQSSSGPNLGPGMFTTGGIQNLVQQITENPQLIVNLCASYTKCMMLSLIQNAQLAAQATFSAESPQHQEPVTQGLPNFFQQIQNPEMLVAMSNPKAMQAWLQIEQGLQTLAAEAPVLLPWFTLRLWGLGNSGSSPSAPDPSPAPSETSHAAPAASEQGHQHLNMLRMLKILPGTNPQHLQAPEIKFQEELEYAAVGRQKHPAHPS
uniref:Ubiquitin-like domain-containing protein n=1 Tax=Chrysemys picta bellii TaxID=8478 RepID=A0A8C3IAG1_CHRPI